MQFVQLSNVGILLSKKGNNSEGADVSLKAFVNYKNIGSGTNDKIEFLFGERYSLFWVGM
jgi:hypothetical protein